MVCDCTNGVLHKGHSWTVPVAARRAGNVHTFDYTNTYFDYHNR
jgi:hypothetical protein